MTDANLCASSTSLCIGVLNDTGIRQQSSNAGNILVYPNPAKDLVVIEYNAHLFDYAIYNNLGQLVKTRTGNRDRAEVNIENLAKGVYVIEVKDGAGSGINKLVIE